MVRSKQIPSPNSFPSKVQASVSELRTYGSQPEGAKKGCEAGVWSISAGFVGGVEDVEPHFCCNSTCSDCRMLMSMALAQGLQKLLCASGSPTGDLTAP